MAVGRGVAVGGSGVAEGSSVAVAGAAAFVAVDESVTIGAEVGASVGVALEDRHASEVIAAMISTIRAMALRGMDVFL